MELNPGHPVTRKLHDEWHKFLAIVMHKQGIASIAITSEDIESLTRAFPGGMPTVVAHAMGDRIQISLVTEPEARRIAEKIG